MNEIEILQQQLKDMEHRMLEQQRESERKLMEQQDKLLQEQQKMQNQMKVVYGHLDAMYQSKSIEETIGVMNTLGENVLECEDVSFYCYDKNVDKVFKIAENGNREYEEIDSESIVGKSLLKNEVYVDNEFSKSAVSPGENFENDTKNIAVIPLQSSSGDILGVVVAKNKETDFKEADIEMFSLNNGEIGSAFRLGLEKERQHQISITDSLTQLRNRAGLMEFAKNNVCQSIEQGRDTTVVMCDIDHFKRVNDTYGHKSGDMVLQHIAKLLRDNVRASDGVFRQGGEEFVIMFNGMNANEAYLHTDRLRQIIENTPFPIEDGKTINITMSMGVEQLENDNVTRENIGKKVDSTLNTADGRLYVAKEERNRVIADRRAMHPELTQSVEYGELLPSEKRDYVVKALADGRTDFSGQNLNGADLSNIDFERCNFKNAKLEDVTFRGSNIKYCDFGNTSIKNTEFTVSYAASASFENATIDKVNMSKGNYANVNFGGATISNVVMSESVIKDADFTNANLQHISALETMQIKVNYNDAKIDDVDFSLAQFQGADLSNAAITNTKFIGTNLYSSKMESVAFDNTVVFTSAKLDKAVLPPDFEKKTGIKVNDNHKTAVNREEVKAAAIRPSLKDIAANAQERSIGVARKDDTNNQSHKRK